MTDFRNVILGETFECVQATTALWRFLNTFFTSFNKLIS